MKMGHPRLDPKYVRVPFKSRVHPRTLRLMRSIAKARGVSLGVLIDQLIEAQT